MGGSNRCRLLLVEDHADTRELLYRLLSRHFDVTAARCADTALAAAAAATPNVVITDIGLPGNTDGLALMRELRDRHGVPGIAVTGFVVEDAPAFRDAGFVAWLTKPIKFEDLRRAIDEACSASV